MLSIARWFLSASLIYLLLGLLAQLVTIFDVWLGFNPLAYTAIGATSQIFILGWLTQLGLALIYERWLTSAKTAAEQSGARPKSPAAVFALFNLGLPLAILGQPGMILWGGAWLGTLAVLGGVLQLLAGLVLVGQVWSVLKKP